MALLNWWRTCSNGSAAQACNTPYGSSVEQTPSAHISRSCGTCTNQSAAQDEGYIKKGVYMTTFMKVYRGVANDFVEEEASTRTLVAHAM